MPIVLVLVFIFNFNNVFGQNKSKAYAWEQAITNGLYINPGNIGIGISSPETALHIHREINFGTDPYSVIRLSINDVKANTHIWDIGNYRNLQFKFSTDGNTLSKMILTPLGQLALGTESPASSAIMQLESTDRGLLLPRLTTAQKEAISSPANGLLVYDTNLQTLSFYDAGIWKQIAINSTFNDYLTITDFNNTPAGGIISSDVSNWNTAHAWGNHSTAGYLTSYTETDPVYTAWDKTTGITITESQITDFGTYLTSYTETDPIYSANFDVSNATNGDLLQYNGSKFIKFTPDYLTSYTETDPVFTAWDKTTGITITESQITDFGTYLTSYTETDPVFNAWDKDFDDLTNKPSLFDGQWSSLSGTLPNISTFVNDVNYITDGNTNWDNEYGFITNADIATFWNRTENSTTLVNINDNVGIGIGSPKKAIHIFRQSNPFNPATQSASLRLENYYTEGISSEGIFYAWDFENNNTNLTLKFGQHSKKPVNNTETKFTFGSNGTLTATKFIGDGSGLTNLTWKKRSNDIYYLNGDVGVGTFDVMAKLHVEGDLYVTEAALIGSTNAHYSNTPTLKVYDRSNRGTLVLASLQDKPTDFVFSVNGKNRVWLSTRNESVDDNAFRIYTKPDGASYPTSRMTIQQNGNVGIGTTSPSSKLHVKDGAILLNGSMESWTTTGWRPRIQSPLGTVWASTNKVTINGETLDYYLGLGMTNTGWYFMNRKDDKDYNYVAVISNDGKISCSEVIIRLDEWKDIVFKEDYKLISIEETEQFISKHGHLPEIPSEKEMIEKGLETSEMIKLQMQKIEELTLYIIEQNKRIKKLEEKIY